MSLHDLSVFDRPSRKSANADSQSSIVDSQREEPVRVSVIIGAFLSDLKSYAGLGHFKQWMVNADGSSQAVYQHGILQFDPNGNRRTGEAKPEIV